MGFKQFLLKEAPTPPSATNPGMEATGLNQGLSTPANLGGGGGMNLGGGNPNLNLGGGLGGGSLDMGLGGAPPAAAAQKPPTEIHFSNVWTVLEKILDKK